MRVAKAKGAPPVRRADDFTDAELSDFSSRLHRYIRARVKAQFRWLGRGPDDLGLGNQCRDIRNEALESLFGGTQAWDPDQEPDPFNHLMEVANSKLINLKERLKRHEKAGEQIKREDVEYDCPSSEPTAEDIVAFREFHDAILEELVDADDNDLIKVYDLALEDRFDPASIAEHFEISAREADNLKKRFKRIVDKARAKLSSTNATKRSP